MTTKKIEPPSAQEELADRLQVFVSGLAGEGFTREQVVFSMVAASINALSETFGEDQGKRVLTWFCHGFDGRPPHPGLAGMETKGRA